jgi:hypothetical protein
MFARKLADFYKSGAFLGRLERCDLLGRNTLPYPAKMSRDLGSRADSQIFKKLIEVIVFILKLLRMFLTCFSRLEDFQLIVAEQIYLDLGSML